MDWVRYSQLSLADTPKPYFVVRFQYRDRSVPVLAVIDSGADYSAFNVDHARQIGFDPNAGQRKEAVAANGLPFKCWYVADLGLEIVVDAKEYPFRGVLLESDTNVLGRRDFFLHFRVQFDEQSMQFGLEQRKE